MILKGSDEYLWKGTMLWWYMISCYKHNSPNTRIIFLRHVVCAMLKQTSRQSTSRTCRNILGGDGSQDGSHEGVIKALLPFCILWCHTHIQMCSVSVIWLQMSSWVLFFFFVPISSTSGSGSRMGRKQI